MIEHGECDYERPIFDADYDNMAPCDPPETSVWSELPPEDMWKTPETSRERSPESFPSKDGLCDGTDTFLYTEHDAEIGLEQHQPRPINPHSSKYNSRHNPKPICNDDYRYWMPNTAAVMSQFFTVLSTEYIRTRSGNAEEQETESIRSTGLWTHPSNLLTCLSPSVLLISKTMPLIFNSVLCRGRVNTNLRTFFFFSFVFLRLHAIKTRNNTRVDRRRYGAVPWKHSINVELVLVEFTFSFEKRK